MKLSNGTSTNKLFTTQSRLIMTLKKAFENFVEKGENVEQAVFVNY